MRVLLLVAEVGPRGGVQLLSRQIAAALAGWCDVTALSFRDSEDLFPYAGDLAGSSVVVHGFNRSRFRFAAKARALAQRSDVVFIAHPHLAALTPFLGASRTLILVHGREGWRRMSLPRRRGLAAAAKVGAVSEYSLRQTRRAQGLSLDREFVLYPGIDEAKWPTFERDPARVPTILSVSRLDRASKTKGVDDVLNVLPLLISGYPRVRYDVVGDGNDRPRLETMTKVLGIQDHVRFLGDVGNAEVNRLFSQAHAFVLPSSEEGFGLVFLEAMAWKVPIVASSAGAAPEVIDGAGIFVDKGDLLGLRDGILRVLENPALAASMGSAGRMRVEGGFRSEHFERRVRSLVESMAAAG